uniref:OSJNBb0040D15.10 protein n=1 Tax=Oryza sativa subsp. japonica TaxID=39947 RepID=Q7XMW4_ORYSJ|nr:OSJNBb0040D15.10 [Oryza sativa Japonica Group]
MNGRSGSVVLCSFAAQLFLALLAGVRRRKATGVRVLLLWAAYQLGGFAGTYALGSMSLSRTTPQQQQQLALWAPFLLLHLAGPDNITAYSLDDTALAGRQVLTVAVQIAGAAYVLYRQIYSSSSSTAGGGDGGSGLMWVSVVMFVIGVAKYVERAVAMRQADLGSMRSSSKKSKLERRRSFSDVRELGNELALLVAHDLLYITKGAFVDHLDDEHPLDRDAVRSEIFRHGWKEMCEVVEMELLLAANHPIEHFVRTLHTSGTATDKKRLENTGRNSEQRSRVFQSFRESRERRNLWDNFLGSFIQLN